MPNNSTEISLSASVLFAWVDTVVIFTGLVLSTIIVHFTLALEMIKNDTYLCLKTRKLSPPYLGTLDPRVAE